MPMQYFENHLPTSIKWQICENQVYNFHQISIFFHNYRFIVQGAVSEFVVRRSSYADKCS